MYHIYVSMAIYENYYLSTIHSLLPRHFKYSTATVSLALMTISEVKLITWIRWYHMRVVDE